MKMPKLYRMSLLALGLALAGIASGANAACSPGALPAEANRVINTGRPDTALFDAAVRYYANVQRCKNGRAPFAADPNLLDAAVAHSKYMAKANNMTHESTQRGMRTLGDRMHKFQVAMRTAGENIAQNFVYALTGRPISAKTRGRCKFTYANGQPVPAHSYASLAQEQVANWMASPKHHKNLMNKRFNRIATGLAYAPDNQTCGRIYMAQDFAGG